jgi:gamma-glutamyltranspeptidase / glutathione hydrolase
MSDSGKEQRYIPVSILAYVYIHIVSQDLIKNASPNGDEMLLDGKAPLPGQIIRLPYLAQTFRELSEKGKDGFYKGRVAKAIVDLIQSQGGVMEMDDLAKHQSTFVQPISYTYAKELSIYEVRSRIFTPLCVLS